MHDRLGQRWYPSQKKRKSKPKKAKVTRYLKAKPSAFHSYNPLSHPIKTQRKYLQTH